MADSFALWWRDAGLVEATSAQAHGWHSTPTLVSPAPIAQDLAESRLEDRPTPTAARSFAAASPSPAPLHAMPADLAAFRTWLAEDPTQPETAWTGPMCLPPAMAKARLLILTDMPDDGFDDPALPFAPANARFVAAMLGNLGLALGDVAIAPLAMRRPPGAILEEATLSALASRMRHYMMLAAPCAALILGDRTSRALTGAQDAPATARLTKINLSAGNLAGNLITAALASPDHLMRRPTAKAASWQTLRLLTGVIAA